MRIVDKYSHNEGLEYIQEHHANILQEISTVVTQVDAEACRLKAPRGREQDKTRKLGISLFYSPPHLNAMFDYYLHNLGWDLKPRLYTQGSSRIGYREMDAIKNRVGLEVQIGKYSFLTYDIVVKMVLFRKSNLIDCGIELCPMASMLPQMSSGIGSFEQVVWDLKYRPVANIDVPAVVIGFESEALPAVYQQPPSEVDVTPLAVVNRTPKLSSGDLHKIDEVIRNKNISIPPKLDAKVLREAMQASLYGSEGNDEEEG